MTESSVSKIAKTVGQLVKCLPTRNKDVIIRRFGLKTGRKETLESIGKGYGITRERVRQIEEYSFAQLVKSAPQFPELEKYTEEARNILNQSGGVAREKDLFKLFSGNEKDSVINASLVLVLTLSSKSVRIGENNNFSSFWALSSDEANNFKKSTASLVDALNKSSKVISQSDFYTFAKNAKVADSVGNFSDKYVNSILAVSKDLGKNIFSEIGLAGWPDIKPRGVRDKAYMVLKRAKNPRHFSDIAKLINTINFSKHKANTQTVHNELIKDNRFVLAEWGYQPGTVKDVLKNILSTSGPLLKGELIAKTMGARMVKENTILLNLQDSKTFKKLENGSYTLKKA